MPILILERIPLPSLQTYSTFSVLMLLSALFYSYQIVRNSPNNYRPFLKENRDEHNINNDLLMSSKTVGTNLHKNDRPELNVSPKKHRHVYDLLHVKKLEKSAMRMHTKNSHNIVNIQDRSEYHDLNGTLPYNNCLFNILYVITAEVWGIWTLVNTAYCCLILIGKLLQMFVFGDLRVIEQQHLRDRFWNFVFYKFIFIFGVMNVQTIEEVIMWVAWFTILGFFTLLTQLCKDRFQYVSSSPTTPRWVHMKILTLLFINLSSCSGLIFIGVMVGLKTGYSILTFMAAECLLLVLKTMYVVVRYAVHLWDMNLEGIWENRSVYVYYTELMFELTSLSIDFAHHLHMLLWGNIFLSMASLVICMHLRYLMYEFQRRFKRHKNYLRVLRNVQSRFAMASQAELEENSDNCAICWEKMESARKLPCSHLFHNSCLRSWLEQDTSCPTCRVNLSEQTGESGDTSSNSPRQVQDNALPPVVAQNAPTTNHFFHFDASRYVSWLPSFSVEVTHTRLLGGGTVHDRVQSSLLDNMAHQVLLIFPHASMNAVLEDLQVTQSVDLTIENILEGRLTSPPPAGFTAFTGANSEREQTPLPAAQQSATDAQSLLLPTPASTLQAECNRAVDSAPSEQNELNEAIQVADTVNSMSDETPSSSGSRFSKSSSEREEMLRQRKSSMIEAARRRFVIGGASGDTSMHRL